MCLTSFQLATANLSKDRPPPLLFDLTPGDPCLNYLERENIASHSEGNVVYTATTNMYTRAKI